MVLRTPKPSRREAACRRVAVVKGGTESRRTASRSTEAMRKTPARMRPAGVSAAAAALSLIAAAAEERRPGAAVGEARAGPCPARPPWRPRCQVQDPIH